MWLRCIVGIGSARARETKTQRTVIGRNLGSGPMQITGLQLIDPSLAWRLVSTNPPLSIYGFSVQLDAQGGPLDSFEMFFEFAPRTASTAAVTSVLRVGTDDPENPIVTIDFTGTALPQTVGTAEGGCATSATSGWHGLLSLMAVLMGLAFLRRLSLAR